MNSDKESTPPQALSKSQVFMQDILWVGIAQFLTSMLSIIILPALTKSYTSEMYGIWVQVNVTASLLSPLLTLQLGSAVVRYLSGEENAKKRQRFFGSILWTIIFFAAFVFLACLLFGQQISVFLFDNPLFLNFVYLTFSWTFLRAVFAILLSYLRARDRIKRMTTIQVVHSIIKILTIVILATTGIGLEWVIFSLVILELVLTLGVLGMIIKDVGFPMPNTDRLKAFLIFSLPLIPSGVLLWIISSSDRYFITHFLDLSQTGIYSSSRALGGLIALFFTPISLVLFPMVSRLWEQKQTDKVRGYLEYSTKLFLTLAIPASLGLTILSQPLLQVLTTSEYLAGAELVLLIAIGIIFLGIYQMNVYVVCLVQQTKWLPLMILGASLVSVTINSILIPRLGIIGAAISNIAAYFVLATIVTIWARKVIFYRVDFLFLSKVIAAALVMFLCLNFIKIDTIWGILLVTLAGVIIYGTSLILMRAFSSRDKRLIRNMIDGFLPKKGRPK